MRSAEFEAKPIKGFRQHTCGTCIYHLPNRSRNIKSIEKGKGKGKPAYWKCKCKGAMNYNEGRVCEDGSTCKHWKNRYKNDLTVKEWIRKIYDHV